MDEQRKNACRYLLYSAMLDIRPIAWIKSEGWERFSPIFWQREWRRVRYSGEIADWLHNLAWFAARDFESFDEEWFWQDFEAVQQRYPEFQPNRYPGHFNQRLMAPTSSQ